MNTWFEKNISISTHGNIQVARNGTALTMRQNQRRLCCDVTVIRSAECWTDHKLLRAKLQPKPSQKIAKGKIKGRFAVAFLHDEKVRQEYITCVTEAVNGKWEMGKRRKWG